MYLQERVKWRCLKRSGEGAGSGPHDGSQQSPPGVEAPKRQPQSRLNHSFARTFAHSLLHGHSNTRTIIAPVTELLHKPLTTGKLWNSLPLSVFPPAYDLLFQNRSVKTPLILNWTSFHVYISPIVLFAGSGDKRDFFSYLIYFSLSHCPFNVKKKKKSMLTSGRVSVVFTLKLITSFELSYWGKVLR